MATDWVDGWLARRSGSSSAMGSLLDPVADKILVLSVLIVLLGEGVFAGWVVAAIVAREFLVSGLRLAALERGVVLGARDLGKAEDVDAVDRRHSRRVRGGGAIDESIAWWALIVALVVTWVSGLDYAARPGFSAAPPRSSNPERHQALSHPDAAPSSSASARSSAASNASRSFSSDARLNAPGHA